MWKQITVLLVVATLCHASLLPLVGPPAPGVVLAGPDGGKIVSPPKPGGVVAASYGYPGLLAPLAYGGGPGALLVGPSGVVATKQGGTVYDGYYY